MMFRLGAVIRRSAYASVMVMASVNPNSPGNEPVKSGQSSSTPNTKAMTTTCSRKIS